MGLALCSTGLMAHPTSENNDTNCRVIPCI